jgi:putative tributyrin esterase
MKKIAFLLIILSWIAVAQAKRHQLVLNSKHIGVPDTVWVFTPSSYEAQSGKSYPTVYLLHGWSGSYHQWDDIMGCQKYADRYGFILICPDGLYNSWYINSPAIQESQYSDFFFLDLVPRIEKLFRVDKRNIFITGLSMGGHGALYLFSQKPMIFKAAGSLSGAVDLNACYTDYEIPKYLGLKNLTPDKTLLTQYSVFGQLDKIAASGKEIIVNCGTEDQFFKSNEELKVNCDKKGIKIKFVKGPGGHNYPYWKANIGTQIEFFKDRVSK